MMSLSLVPLKGALQGPGDESRAAARRIPNPRGGWFSFSGHCRLCIFAVDGANRPEVKVSTAAGDGLRGGVVQPIHTPLIPAATYPM